MKTQVIELKQGDTCKIDCGTHGDVITGPAYIVVLQNEAAVVATTSLTPTDDKYNRKLS